MSESARALAAQHLDTRRPAEALAALDRQGGDDALLPSSLALRARALLGLGRPAEARRAAERGLAQGPTDVGLLAVLCAACLAEHDLPAAERAVLAALRTHPENAALMVMYSEVLVDDGQDSKAQQVLDRAAALDPGSSEVARARAYAAHVRGDARSTTVHARAALRTDPGSVGAHALLGAGSLERGSVTEGFRHSRRAAAGSPGDAELAAMAREARLAAHWSTAPLRVLARFGPGPVWLFGVVLIFSATRLLPGPAALAVAVGWVVFCIYSWVAPPLLRRWARQRW